MYANEISFSGLLMDISRVIPSTAALTSMTATSQEPTPIAGGLDAVHRAGSMSRGLALDYDTIASWLTRLERVRGWVNPWVTSIADPENGPITYTSGVDLTEAVVTARGRAGGGSGRCRVGEPSIVAGAGAAILGCCLVLFLVLPEDERGHDSEGRARGHASAAADVERQLNALEQARDEAPENEAAIREVEGKVPPTADLPGAILFLRNAAAVSGVAGPEPHAGDTRASEPAGGFSSISVSASGEGSYFALVKYLHEIETLPRAATVESIDLSPLEGTVLSFAATITLYTSDVSSGPGSEPGPTEQGAIPGA